MSSGSASQPMIRPPWTPARIARAQAMWLAGTSAAAIGTTLGVTRNAVIGKLTRLGLARSAARQADVDRGTAAEAKTVEPRRPRPAAPKPAAREPRVRVSEPEPTTDLMGLEDHMCRWPIGDPRAAGFGFCGRPAKGSFCAAHRRRAYKPGPLEPIERVAGLEPRRERSDAFRAWERRR